jgi:iron(III) transport system substrate-binding protein
MFSAEGQQVMIDLARHALGHPLTKEKPGRKSLSQIKLMKDDARAVERESENIKKRYSQIFKV